MLLHTFAHLQIPSVLKEVQRGGAAFDPSPLEARAMIRDRRAELPEGSIPRMRPAPGATGGE